MGIFSDYNYTGSTITFTGNITSGTNIHINYSYSSGSDVRGNKHVDIDRMAELQKLIAKNPNRTDLKMELMKLQKLHKPKIGKRKKKK